MLDTKKSAGGAATPSAESMDKISPTIIQQAKEKIKTPTEAKLNNKAKAIEIATATALKQFCDQSEEFARAVIESDKTFDGCLSEIVKGVGSSISDFDVFTKAVQYYFPGAVVEFKMLIHMSEYEIEEQEHSSPAPQFAEPPKTKQNISLSLDSLLDW